MINLQKDTIGKRREERVFAVKQSCWIYDTPFIDSLYVKLSKFLPKADEVILFDNEAKNAGITCSELVSEAIVAARLFNNLS